MFEARTKKLSNNSYQSHERTQDTVHIPQNSFECGSENTNITTTSSPRHLIVMLEERTILDAKGHSIIDYLVEQQQLIQTIHDTIVVVC
jgi:hypothetical protein